MRKITTKLRFIILLMLLMYSSENWAQTNNYFGTSGTITGSVWNTNPAGPYDQPLNLSGGPILNFNNSGSATGGTIASTVGINFGAAITWSAGGTIGAAGINLPINVSAGIEQDFGGSQSFSSSATAAFTKNGDGAVAMAGNTYQGGFTINSGTLIVRGVNAMGGGAANTLTINGGTISSNADRNLTGKYGGGITIAGDFTIGANTGLSSNTAALSFTNNVSLGSSTRSITIGNNATHTFSGVISGSAGLSIGATGSGTILLTGANTYTGLTTISNGTLRFNRIGGTTIPATNDLTISGGTLRVSTNQTIANLTLSSGTLSIDAGVTLTITGTFSGSGGTISNSGTIKLTGGATNFPGSGVTVNNGTSGTMTNLEVATSADVSITGGFTISGTLTLTSGKLLLGGNDLTIGSGGNIVGASSSKYVVSDGSGSLIRNSVTSAKIYPVGDATYYTPVTITNIGTSDNFGVNVSSASAPVCLTTAPFSDATAVMATWNITEGTGGGSNCTLVIDYGTVPTGGSYTIAGAKIAHCDGTIVDYKNGSVTGTIATGSGFTVFSPFGISSDANLPIELIRFTGTANNRETNLIWQTATEINNSHFSIQRSPNGRDFFEIGEVKGAGTSYEPQEYTFTDERPLPGKNYYRLKQVDFDGKFSYSPVVTATFGKAGQMTLAPLPATETLNIQLEKPTQDDGLWQVFDMNGRLLLSGEMIAETTEQAIRISALPEGAYVLRLTVGQQVLVEQFRKH